MEEAKVRSLELQTIPRRRVFTVAAANQTLPLVGRVVQDVVTLCRQMVQTQQQLAADSNETKYREELEAQADRQELEFERYVDELSNIGCELKDANIGLVDFVGRHEGRDVYLCWRLGERQIEFWHELHAGFSGRRPVSVLKEE